MNFPVVQYVAAAGQTDFDVPFPYLSPAHVEVLLNGVSTPVVGWTNATRLKIGSVLVGGESVIVQRVTPVDTQFVEFQNSAVLTQEDLNTAVQQLLFKHQELEALYHGALKSALVRLAENLGIVTDPVAVAQELAELVLEQEVLDNFRQRIADIDAAGLSIVDQGIKIDEHTQAIIDGAASRDHLNDLLTDLRADHEALAGVVDALAELENGEGLAALIESEKDARIAGDTALAAVIALIGAKSDDSSAFILDLDKVKVSPTESLANRFSAISAKADDNAALIQAETNARVAADSAEATARNSLAATLRDETAAAVSAEASARATAVSAEATARNNLAATLRGETDTKISSAITTEQNARVAGDSAEATARNSLAATLRGETAAAVNAEATARITQDNVHTGWFQLLGAKNAAGTAWILDDNKVQLSSTGQAIGARLSGIDVAISGVSASVVNEQNARIAQDGVLANSITSVQTNVNGLTASVSTLSSSVNGLSAKYGVSLDVNGFVTGFVQNNNGSSGSFHILANVFAIVDPGSGTPTVPFEVSGGVTRIKKAIIGELAIDLPRLDRSTMTANTQSSVSGFNSASALGGGVDGVYYVPSLGADMAIQTGGSIYCTIDCTGSLNNPSTGYICLDILRASDNVQLRRMLIPQGSSSTGAHFGTTIRLLNNFGAQTIRWRIGLRKSGANSANIYDPTVQVYWTAL